MGAYRGIKQLLAASFIVSLGATLLSGCSTEVVADAPQTQTAAPSEKLTSTPTPSESGTPTAAELDPATPSSWIISPEGVGPVVYGGVIADVRPSMGAFAEIPSEWCGVARFRSEEKGLAILAMLGDDGSTISGMILSGWNRSEESATQSPRTAEGIGIGSSLSELQSAYPTITMTAERATEPPTQFYSIPNPDGSWLVFSVYEDTVGAIAINDKPSLMSEYCA